MAFLFLFRGRLAGIRRGAQKGSFPVAIHGSCLLQRGATECQAEQVSLGNLPHLNFKRSGREKSTEPLLIHADLYRSRPSGVSCRTTW